MDNYAKKVQQFHEMFSLPVLNEPTLIDKKRFKLRIDLIKEELDELIEAYENSDIVEIADALGDLQYVLSGAVLELGFGEKIEQIFDEIDSSNMTKACSDYEQAMRTQKWYKDERGTDSIIEKKGDVYLVLRSPDRKVLKNIDYRPADIKKILE